MTVTVTDLADRATTETLTGGIVDAAGNLLFYGDKGLSVTVFEPGPTTATAGEVLEFSKTAAGYSQEPTVVAQFTAAEGIGPEGSLVMDAAGNLYGVTWRGGADYDASAGNHGYGSVFEIARTAGGYSSTPAALASFDYDDGVFQTGLLIDSAGNLFGTSWEGGAQGSGSVFELPKNGSVPVLLASFPKTSGVYGPSDLIADSSGNLIGVTNVNLATASSVFEVAKTASGYSGTITTLASFAPTSSAQPYVSVGGLMTDARGNLVGVVEYYSGTTATSQLFEIAKTADGYAGAPTILTTAAYGIVNLLMDSSGDIFVTGTPTQSGALLELAKNGSGYASDLATVYSFGNGAEGAGPSDLFADSSGNLYGVTSGGGADGHGAVFEIAGSGFTISAASALSAGLTGAAAIGDTAANIQADLDGLETLAAAGKIASIGLTDGGTPTLTVTSAQLVGDLAALKRIGGSFNLDVTAPASGATIIGGTVGEGTTVVFSGASSAYTITPTGDGHSLTVSQGSATYPLDNVNALQFSDTTDIVASASPAAGGSVSSAQITNVYAAVLAREPDVGGLAFYQQYALKNPATPIATYAEFFLRSAEYTADPAHAYADTTAGDAQFITDTYQNLLHRTPSADEVAFYQKAIAQILPPTQPTGAEGGLAYEAAELAAHATILAYFSQSPEFLSDVQVTAQTPSSASHWLVLI